MPRRPFTRETPSGSSSVISPGIATIFGLGPTRGTWGHIRKLIVFVKIAVTERIKGYKTKSMKTLTIAKQAPGLFDYVNRMAELQEHSLSLGSIGSSHRLGEISSDLGKNSRRLGPGAWGSAAIRSGDDVQDLGSAKVLPSVGRADAVSNQGSAFLSEVSGVDLGRCGCRQEHDWGF